MRFWKRFRMDAARRLHFSLPESTPVFAGRISLVYLTEFFWRSALLAEAFENGEVASL
jgi:hypothetical protein